MCLRKSSERPSNTNTVRMGSYLEDCTRAQVEGDFAEVEVVNVLKTHISTEKRKLSWSMIISNLRPNIADAYRETTVGQRRRCWSRSYSADALHKFGSSRSVIVYAAIAHDIRIKEFEAMGVQRIT
jgi:hypothetical protein